MSDLEPRDPPTLAAFCGRRHIRRVALRDNLPPLRALIEGSQVGVAEKRVLCPHCGACPMQEFNLDSNGLFFRCTHCNGVWRVE